VSGSHRARAARAPKPLRIAALVVVVPLAVATLAAMVWLWPGELPDADQGQGVDQFEGVVERVQVEECPEGTDADVNGCGQAVVRLTKGADETVDTLLPNGAGAPEVAEGDEVVLIRSETPDGQVYSIVDHQRLSELWLLAIVFAVTVIVFGRWRGLTALVGLAATFLLLLFFVVPAILTGEPPLLVAIVGSAAIALAVLYLTHGFSLLTTVAVVGTLGSLALTGVLGALSVGALHLTGVTDDVSASLALGSGLNTEGLLLAGIVIGSLGVLDDVTVTQAATVQELARASPRAGVLGLYRAGSRVGRSHIASVINTIVLAYAGSALPLMIIIVAQRDSLGDVVTDQIIAQEIVRSVVATLGLIAAVPITTALAALVSREAGRLEGSVAQPGVEPPATS
jgi:uncharacterized membrane protein